jgi:hypothetical protein
MADATWKAVERRIARILGGRRVGNRGKATSDIDHFWLAPEVKHRKNLPAWIKDAIGQAVAAAGKNKLPLAILHERDKPWQEDFVVLRLGDFVDWFNPAGPQGRDDDGDIQE